MSGLSKTAIAEGVQTMSNFKVTPENFLKDIEDHVVNIKMDNGIYRHLFCSSPATNNQSFNIVTTPCYLIYYGDMGSFTFSRVDDMFRFFRRDTLSINEGYWSEKLTAVDRTGGYKEFNWDEFLSTLRDFAKDEEDEDQDSAIQAFLTEELYGVEPDEFGAVTFIRDFDENNVVDLSLSDFFECTFHIPTTRYIWCCYAIVWAIQQYDLIGSAD
jgi:hypothetical protein